MEEREGPAAAGKKDCAGLRLPGRLLVTGVTKGDADVCQRCPLSYVLPLLLLTCQALACFIESNP